jgi:DNA polymerase-4
MMEQLENIANALEKRLKKHSISGKTVTLKIKYSDFTQQTRSKTLPYFISDKGVDSRNGKRTFVSGTHEDSVRLLGFL